MSNTNLNRTRFVAVVVLLSLVVGILLGGENVYAYEKKSATIKYDVVNIRAQSSTSSSVVSQLALGDKVTIVGEVNGSDSYVWYQIEYTVSGTAKSGWVRSDCITINETVTEDAAFEAYLTEQKFPESYKDKLRILHSKYPNWVFEAQHTGLKWSNAVAAENVLGMSLVSSTSISSWKSLQDGAYNWDTSKWIGLDGDSWVAASEEIIAYYMDPRNFLDDTYVFQFLEQSYDSKKQTKTGVATMTKGTFMAGTYTEGSSTIAYADTLIDAAKQSSVNPYVLASMILTEQGTNGSGKSISGTVSGYKGYYNHLNIGAWATSTMTAVQRGLWFASGSGQNAVSYGRPWNTITKSIVGGAIYYAGSYVSVGQDTLYLKKWNVQGTNPYTHQYMTNVAGAATESAQLAKAFGDEARKETFVFKIPVYTNMPDSVCEKPTVDGSPNYMLKTLTVSGQKLSPTFNKNTTKYTLTVPYDTASITIGATAIDSSATVSGTGKKSLGVGLNTYKVKVKAGNGTTRTYTLKVTREEEVYDPAVLSTSSYRLDETADLITGIKSFPIKASKFLAKFTVTEGSIKLTDANGKEYTGNVGTGCQLRVYDIKGKLQDTYDVLIYGDTNGDGKVNQKDVLCVQKAMLSKGKLKGLHKTAMDISRNGELDMLDLVKIQKHISGEEKIEQ